MSILTPFFKLIKPAKTDRYIIDQFNANMDTIDTEMHRPPLTVNGYTPDNNRNIYLETVPLADNLSTDEAQFVSEAFLVRTSGGGAPISDGAASISTIKGNQVKTGYVAESIEMTVNAVPRTAPAEITATLDAETFEAYVESAGTYTLTYTTSWSADPSLYGVTVSNTPVSGDSIVIEWDGENDPTMSVNAVTRPVPAPITATINKATFRAYVGSSGTTTLTYSTAWSANPALYGVTVYNTPVSGDTIVIVYVKENRGTITTANVSAFNATGWNLYDDSTDMARVVKYSDDYGYKVGGSYSLLLFALTPDGETTSVDVQNGYFNVPADGYILVTGGNATTYIYPTWSDWISGYQGDFQTYTVNTLDMSGIMANFSAGLCAVGDVRDEINFNIQKAISRIERLAYTAENLAAAIASGRLYDTDTNYIYLVRASAVETSFSLDGDYTVCDHGLEFFTASTNVPPITDTLYGENLKDKLRTDVVTISGGLVNNLTSTATNKALTAKQGNVLDGKISSANTNISKNTVAASALESGIAIVSDGDTHGAIKSGDYVYVKNHSTLTEGLYRATADISENGTVSSSNLTSAAGICNAMNKAFIFEGYSCQIASIAAGSYTTLTASDFGITEKTGYTFAGIVAYEGGSFNLVPYRMMPRTSGNVFSLRNVGTSASSANITIYIKALWVRDELI